MMRLTHEEIRSEIERLIPRAETGEQWAYICKLEQMLTVPEPTIKTTYDPKPIPDRRFDWSAVFSDTYDGAEDAGNARNIGSGATEQEAIDDLMSQNMECKHVQLYCPQCGEETDRLHEGYCEDCWSSNQASLDLHNAQYDRWQKLSDEERSDEIRRAIRNA